MRSHCYRNHVNASRLSFEQPKVNAISGVVMVRALAAIKESWRWAGGLQDGHFSAPGKGTDPANSPQAARIERND